MEHAGPLRPAFKLPPDWYAAVMVSGHAKRKCLMPATLTDILDRCYFTAPTQTLSSPLLDDPIHGGTNLPVHDTWFHLHSDLDQIERTVILQSVSFFVHVVTFLSKVVAVMEY